MADRSRDWDLGQTLIEKGLCSLDQVREALSIQDRMKAMGVVPKPLPEILLEKGYVTAEQLREAGIQVTVVPKPAPRPSAVRRPERKRSPAPWFALVAASGVVALLLFFAGDILKALNPPKTASKAVEPAGPSDAEKADRAAKDDLDRIAAFARTANDFENADEVAKRYDAYMKKHAGQKWELEANRALQEYRGKADAFARPRLEEILTQEVALREQGRTAELIRRLRAFPARFLQVTESGRVVREKLSELTARQREAYLRDKAEAEKLLRERKFEAALDKVVALKLSAPEESLNEVGDFQTRIDFEYKAATQKVRQELADVYYKIDGSFKEALLRRPCDPRKAAAAVGEFLYAPWHEEQRPFVRMRGVDYDALKKALDEWRPEAVAAACEAVVPDAASPDALSTAETAMLDLRNAALVALFYRDLDATYPKVVAGREPLDLPDLGAGRFEKRGDKTVFVADGRGVIDQPLSEVDLATIAMRAGPLDAGRHARVGFYYYYTAPSQVQRAYAHLLEAQKGGVKGVRPYLSNLAAAAQAELSRTLRVKFDAATDFFKRKQGPQAKKVLEEVLEQPEHPFVKAKRVEIEKMLFEIAEGSEKERRLAVTYKGKGEALDGGRARITYDFSDKAHLDAFEFVTEEGARKFKGRWRLERGALESSSEPSVMCWKTPVKGDVVLEYDLAILEEPQNIVVDLYYHKGQSRHYAAVMGFDWVGKADGDAQNTAEDRFGIPRTCVIKYPVFVDKSRWVLAEHWENWRTRLVGGPKGGAWKPSKGKTHRIQFAREGKSVRLLADKAVVWEGEDDAYTEGQILFFSDSRCRVGNLSVAFRPE